MQPYKQILLFIALLTYLCPQSIEAQQNLKFDIVKFELNQLDGTASNKNYEKIDGSGNKYAIIKVRSTDGDEGLSEFMFNFNSLKSIVEDKGDELWVYVQKNAKIVTISREGYTPLRNFDLKMTLQAGKTYNMEITYDRVEKIVKKELYMQMLTFKLTPAVEGAVVMYKKQGSDKFELLGNTDKQGTISKNLGFGTYEYQVLSQKHFTSEGIVKLNNSDEVHTENITLKSNTSDIALVTAENADIYVNGELKDRGIWKGTLRAGEYVVECKQEGHRPTSQKIVVEPAVNKLYELLKPTPITGFVSVTSTPAGATVLIDDKESGKTPCNIKDVLVGYRKVTLSLTDYNTASTVVEVKEGEVANASIALNNFSQAELEELHMRGIIADENKEYAEAVKWFAKAAELGYANAQWMLGYCYEMGQGVAKDYVVAVKWYREAAAQGHITAQWFLGSCYEIGKGVAKDYTEAAKWYREAAKQGDAWSQSSLGRCYEYGKGVALNHTEAVKWYMYAAEQGNAWSQYSLGRCYEQGKGVYSDQEMAAMWYRKAATQGNADAQYSLGRCYELGVGVARDTDEAAKWYTEAAEQGHENARKALEKLQK